MPTSFQVGGISRWNRESDEWTYFEAPLISNLYRDDVVSISGNDRYIAFATILGVAIYDKNKDRWRTISALQGLMGDQVFDVVANDSVIYVATEYGFNWIDLYSMKVYSVSDNFLDQVTIYQLAVDSDELVWAATRYGLYSIDLYQDKVTFHGSKAGVIDYNLNALEIIGDEIWFASNNGISYWNRSTDTWISFPALQINAQYRDIAATKDCVWFATDRGLLKYDRERDYWRLFTKKDGLLSKNVYHIDPEGQYLWLTTDHGITAFVWNREDRID
jgi:ligand-binding sensor domain-containing protein